MVYVIGFACKQLPLKVNKKDEISDKRSRIFVQSEVMVRVNRMFSPELQQNLNAVAFFLEPRYERVHIIEREEHER